MHSVVLELVKDLSGGNPGALKVLVELIKDDDESFFNPFVIAFKMTKSKPYAIWLAYKKCEFNLKDTKTFLRDWYSNSVEPLEIWLENKGT